MGLFGAVLLFLPFFLALTGLSYGFSLVLTRWGLRPFWSIFSAYFLTGLGYVLTMHAISYAPELARLVGPEYWLDVMALFEVIVLAPFCIFALVVVRGVRARVCVAR